MLAALWTGFLQTLFGSLNIIAISHRQFAAALSITFAFHIVWTMNVRASLGGWPQRVAYALGAVAGVATGLIASAKWL